MNRPAFAASLRARLLLLILLAVLPTVWLIVYAAFQQRRMAAEGVERNVRGLVAVAVHDHERSIEQTQRLLKSLSHLPVVRALSPRACSEILPAVLEGYSRFINIGLIGADGEIRCMARPTPAGVRPSPVVMAAVHRSLASGGFVMSEYTVGQVSRRPIVAVVHAIPAPAGGPEGGAVVYASLSLEWLNEFARQTQLPEGSTLTVLDPAGTVLVRHPEVAGWIGARAPQTSALRALLASSRDTSYTAAGLDGVERLYAATPLRGAGDVVHGYAVIGVPTHVIYADQIRFVRDSAILLVLVTLFALLAVWVGGDLFILRRVRALLDATRRLQAGDRTARTGIRGPGELDQLGAAFDDMAGSLQRRQEELEAAAEALRRQALVFDTLHEGVVVTDIEGRITDWNHGAEQIFGYSREEIVGQTPRVYHHPTLAASIMTEILDAVKGHGRWEGVMHFVRKDGTHGVSELVVVTQLDAAGRPIALIGAHRDVTERKQAEDALREREEQLQQAQKMEAMGRLAGGVAHDFNNLLTAIRGNVEIALLDVPVTSPVRGELEQIQMAADTAAAVTRQLLSFTRRAPAQPQLLRVGETADRATRLLRRLLGPEVDLAMELGDTRAVRADPGQLEQVLLNLTLNARDAMPGGGRVTIRCADVDLRGEEVIRVPYMDPGAYVELSVIDTGTGMDPLTQQRIFEPFFTTKEKEKGTGLGLFTVYGIVRQAGGHIWVESAPGSGTSVHILLPAAPVAATADPAPPPAGDGDLPGGAETVLLVDDEAPVRLLAQRLLQRVGYRVLEATDGEDALRVAASHPEPIHLMLTDMTMPRMNGAQLAQHMVTQRPDMKIVFMSGYTEEALPIGAVHGSYGSFIYKPFTLNTLARSVRAALDG